MDDPAEIDDDIATNGPTGCTIATCFDGNCERMCLTEDDGSRRLVVSEADARDPNVCLQLTG